MCEIFQSGTSEYEICECETCEGETCECETSEGEISEGETSESETSESETSESESDQEEEAPGWLEGPKGPARGAFFHIAVAQPLVTRTSRT